MAKLPTENENQMWALAYSTAAAFLTLGASVKHGLSDSPDYFAERVDERAQLIADNAIKHFKKRKVI